MNKEDKVDYYARICGILAIIIAAIALWQTKYNLRPIVSFTEARLYRNISLPTGDLDFGLLLVFQNTGGADIRHLKLNLVCIVENTVAGPTEASIDNVVHPGNYFTCPMTTKLPASVCDKDTQGLSKLKHDLPIRIIMEYRALFLRHRQVFNVSWNKDINLMQHCDVNELKLIEKALIKKKKDI